MADAVYDLGDSLSIGFTLFILFNFFKKLKVTLILFFQAVSDEKTQEKKGVHLHNYLKLMVSTICILGY